MRATNKILIIVGSAPCCADDIAAALASYEMRDTRYELRDTSYELRATRYDYMLIGLDSVEKIPWPAKYFATYHPVDIVPAIERRRAFGGNVDFEKIIAHQQHAEPGTGRALVDMIIPCEPPSGSSGLLGVLAGIKLGYEKIILCGCPLSGKNADQYDYAEFRRGWPPKLAYIKDKTRSMSGWTRELLGAPTAEWLESEQPPEGGKRDTNNEMRDTNL